MSEIALWALLMGVSYLVGSLPIGVIISRLKYGIDIREMGSGNIGATNMKRTFGWCAGSIVFLLDFLKGALPVLILVKVFPEAYWLFTMSAITIILGHCFSLYLKFSGGKGVATSLGCYAILVPQAALVFGVAYLILALLSRISAVGSIGGIIAVLIYIVITRPMPQSIMLIVSTSIIMVIRHQSNIKRLAKTHF